MTSGPRVIVGAGYCGKRGVVRWLGGEVVRRQSTLHHPFTRHLDAGFRVHPRLAVRPAQQLVRLVVADHLLLGRVPGQRPAELHRQVRQDAARRRDVPLLDVGDRLAARLDRPCRKFRHVAADRRRDVPLQVLLGLVLRVLVVLDAAALPLSVGFLPPAGRIVLVDARLERALVAVDDRRPGVLRVGRVAPGAVLSRRPGSRRSRTSPSACRRCSTLRSFCTRMPPAEEMRFGQPRSSIQRTMSSMWMHMSPTMPLPYSMNARHQRRCGSGRRCRRRRVVRPQRGRAGPHLVVEVRPAASCPAGCRWPACGSSSRSRRGRSCRACPP